MDGDRLFIPNSTAPKLSLNKVTGNSSVESIMGEPVNQQIGNAQFPRTKGITIPSKFTGGSNGVTLIGGYYGFLNDLYINFDFAKGIMETPNFFIKDALYQILNGISSACNGMWNFQIQEVQTESKKSTELRVFEMNSISSGKPTEPYEFNLIGSDSVFIDRSCDTVPFTMPNIFTPNIDGINDDFVPIEDPVTLKDYFKSIDFIVYNRWGRTVYLSSDVLPLWNGKNIETGDLCSAGVYFWVIEYKDIYGKNERLNGFVHLTN